MTGYSYEPINGWARHKEVTLRQREWRELIERCIAAGGRRFTADGDTLVSMPSVGLVFEIYGSVE
jgi:hypothetical protein